MDPEEFQKLSFLPLPLLTSSKDHYLPFSDLYGSIPSEKDRPSSQHVGDVNAIEADSKQKILFNSSKVHTVIHCQECFKPRCVFSTRKLEWSKRVLLIEVTEDQLYTTFHSRLTCIVVQQYIGCSNPMES